MRRAPRFLKGMHLRMSGPKELIADIKGHEGSRIEITGLMKKGQPGEGVSIGGVHVSPAPSGPSGSMRPSPGVSQERHRRRGLAQYPRRLPVEVMRNVSAARPPVT